MIYYFFVILAGILSGVIVFGGQVFANLGLSAIEISIIPYTLSVLVLLPFVLFNKRYWLRRENLGLLILWGAATTVTVIGQYFSLYFGIPVAIVVLLLYSQPFWTTLICRLFFKESVHWRQIIACVIVLIGLVILVNPFRTSGSYNLIGLILALLGGLSLSFWVIIGSLLSKRGNHPLSTQFFGVAFGAILLGLLIPILSQLGLSDNLISINLHKPVGLWIWLTIFSIFALDLCQILYLYGVKKVPTVTAGIILLLEPVTGALLATIFLGQKLSLNIIVGGALILLANYLVITKDISRTEV